MTLFILSLHISHIDQSVAVTGRRKSFALSVFGGGGTIDFRLLGLLYCHDRLLLHGFP
jgi:hypothetical protein